MASDPARVAGIDIDGVLADPRHRLHFLARRPKDWRGFFAQAHRDPPLEEGIRVVRDLVSDGVTIVYVTGRPESLRRATRQWLTDLGLPDDVLYMRARGDYRPAPQVKLEIYRALEAQYRLETIVDDDERVLEVLSAAGLPVMRADWFDPESPVLSEAQDEQGRT